MYLERRSKQTVSQFHVWTSKEDLQWNKNILKVLFSRRNDFLSESRWHFFPQLEKNMSTALVISQTVAWKWKIGWRNWHIRIYRWPFEGKTILSGLRYNPPNHLLVEPRHYHGDGKKITLLLPRQWQ